MSSPPTITAKALRACVLLACEKGVHPAELLAPFGVDMAVLEDVDAKVPFAWVARAWTDAPTLSGDPDFGLHSAEIIVGKPSHVFDYIAQVSQRPRQLFEFLVRYQRLLSSNNDIRLKIDGDGASLSRYGEAPPQFIVFVVAQWVFLARRRSKAGFPLRRATFRHARPASTAEYERIFQAPVEFGAARDGIEFDARLLDMDLEGTDPGLLSVLRRHSEALLADLPKAEASATTTAGDVRRHILGLPPAASPTIDEVGRALGVSSRTLQRQLQAEGLTFKAVVEAARRDLALGYLRERQHSVSEVAFLAGFAEVSAFSRAFRRWTGSSPVEWRRANLAPRVSTLARAVKTP